MKLAAVTLAGALGCACATLDTIPPQRSEAAPAPPPAPTLPDPDWPRLATDYLKSKQPLLRRCYEDEVHRVEDDAAAGDYKHGEPVPNLQGRLVLAIPVEVDGTVVAARIDDDTLKNERVGKCLLDEAKRLRFAPPTDHKPVELGLPFSFQLSGPSQ